MVKVPGKLIKETRAMIRLYLFLRHECKLKEDLSLKDLKALLNALKIELRTGHFYLAKAELKKKVKFCH